MTDSQSGDPPVPKRPVRIPRPGDLQPFEALNLTPPPIGRFQEVLTELTENPPATAPASEEESTKSAHQAETLRPLAFDPHAADALGLDYERSLSVSPGSDSAGFEEGFDFVRDDELEPDELPSVPGATTNESRPPSANPPRPSDAPLHLRTRGLTAAWTERAEWFEQQAELAPDPIKRGRAWLVSSELWAMAGISDRARTAAERAIKYGNALAARQLRQLAMTEGDLSAATLLSAEVHHGPTPAARTHAANLSAEYERARKGDPGVVARQLDQAARNDPSDPRPGLLKLAGQLGTSAKGPSFRWPKLASFGQLERATATLASLRGETRSSAANEESVSPVVNFVEVTRALARADRVSAANALLLLANEPGFARPARWLAAALYAPLASTRLRSAEILCELLRERPSVAIRRALAARALELGDRTLLDLALAGAAPSEASDPALSVPDRVAFAVLLDSPPEELLPWLEHAARQDELRPLAAALFSALNRADATSTGPLRVGRVLGTPGPNQELGAALAVSPTLPSELRRALALEVAFQSSDVKASAEALVGLAAGQDDERERHAHVAAALLLEHAGQTEGAERHYGHALRSSVFGEVATRALISLTPRNRTAKLLSALAPTIADEERRALLLLEAALKTSDASDANALAEAAHELYPGLALPIAIGQRLTLGQESPGQAIAWLANEATLAENDYERALVAVRQALLSGADTDQANVYLSRAWGLWPKDITLLELQERLTSAPLGLRAKNRELLAASLTDAGGRGHLLLEAARYYEHAGLDADAARVAEAAMRTEPLARVCFERTALRTPRVVSIKNALESELSVAKSPREKAELCLRLAAIDARSGNDSAQGHWLQAAVQHDPAFLRALIEYEQFALQRGLSGELARIERLIARQLSSVEATAHALLAARFEQEENGWGAAFSVLRLAERGKDTPFWIARKLLPHAARGADDALHYSLLEVLRREVTHDLDRATLALRSAETASRLGQPALALEHLNEATRLAPQHPVAHSLRAELLRASGDLPRAAEAFERVARLSSVAEHQTDAWKTAASLWLEVDDSDRAQAAYERALKAAPTDDDAFESLLARYRQGHAKQKLLELLHTRVDATRRPEERSRLRLLESRILTEFGDTKAARATLELLLSTNPEDVAALTQLAELSEAEANTQGAEQALLQLARLNPDPQSQADTYAKLAILYLGPLNQPQRALRCYQEVLRRRPTDLLAFTGLVNLLVDQGFTEKAMTLISDQEKLLVGDDAKRTLALCLARVQARGQRDFAAAEMTYQKALGQWPSHPHVLAGLVDLYRIADNRAALTALANAYGAEVRAQLPDKPGLEAALHATRLVAELDGDDCCVTLTHVAQQQLQGNSVLWPGAQGRAMSRNLDELLAPKPISSSLRSLLMQTHAVLDRAFELDLAEIGASPLSSQRVVTSFEVKARAMGIACPQLYSISGNPFACLVTNNPSRVILGSGWIETAVPSSLDFLAWRSLKLVQARVGIIERLRGQQLLATLEAFLGCFVDSKPGLADPRLVEAMRRRLVEHLPKRLDDDLPVLALSVVSDLKDRQLGLDDAIRRWVNRSALLATGDLRAALHALALKHGEPLPTTGEETVRFLKKVPEGFDLTMCLADPGFLDACRMTKEPSS